MKLLLSIISTLCFYCIPFVAQAQQLCPDSAKDWQCFGQIDIKMEMNEGDGPKEAVMTRWVFLDNDEKLIHVEVDGEQFKYFMPSPRVMLYSGKGSENQVNDLAIVAPVYAAFEMLASAYPLGPESVPEGTTTRSFEAYGGSASETITTTRSGSSPITYQIGNEKSAILLSGSWDSALAEHYPDDFSLSGWNPSRKDVFKNLMDARAMAVSNAIAATASRK